MPYNLPYSEYVDADPTVEDMNSVVNLKVSSEEKSYFYLKQLEMIPYLYKPAVPIRYQYPFFQKIRPSMHPSWNSSKFVSGVSILMKESWQPNPSARPPMLRAKKTLHSLKDTLEKEKSNSRQVNHAKNN